MATSLGPTVAVRHNVPQTEGLRQEDEVSGKEVDSEDNTGRSRGVTKIFEDTTKKPSFNNLHLPSSSSSSSNSTPPKPSSTRSRSTKRSSLYESINNYQTSQLTSLSAEFKYEEGIVLQRISDCRDGDVDRIEREGEGCYDLLPELRGTLLSDSIYRLSRNPKNPPNLFSHNQGKFKPNDVIVLTRQSLGKGDRTSCPVDSDAVKFEVVVSGVGPTYIDVVISDQAKFDETFSNDQTFLRADRYFSTTSYERMCEAVKSFCNLEEEEESLTQYRDLVVGCFEGAPNNRIDQTSKYMSTPINGMHKNKAKTAYSTALSKFSLNNSQLSAVALSLSRKLTSIIGPPGTGKTFTGCAIAEGFTHLLNSNEKVLCCAYSNVGADNFARGLKARDLKVLRVGRATAISPDLLEDSLEYYLENDKKYSLALANAKKATKAAKNSRDKNAKMEATAAVKKADVEKMKAAAKIMENFNVVVSTCIGSADAAILTAQGKAENYSPPSPLSFPYLIIDEACQSLEAATLVPLTTTRCKSIVLLGDPMQLPPTVLSSSPTLETSLMERLTKNTPAPVMVTAKKDVEDSTEDFLKTVKLNNTGKQGAKYIKNNGGGVLLKLQYRMHPSISAWPSAQFYEGLLATPTSMIAQREGGGAILETVSAKLRERTNFFGNVGVVHVESEDGSALEERSEGKDGIGEGTFKNLKEAEIVTTLIHTILNEHQNTLAPSDIGVITPYNGQKTLLKNLLSSTQPAIEGVEVNTVDGFQGREKRVIIFSAVRSNKGKKVGFLSDGRRMNVALTRAKDALIVVADTTTVGGGDRMWGQFFSWVESNTNTH
ncbi:hypothetical protein TrLO_g10143 [Triparma laevis f. longispina]|uniref:Uncharacterized protein n=1 Tax=Triparma laevis f. longispina TaxID=1714387 RepID=A0A9W7ACP2_9STRA|nr:hypothetical protein TrLO_g10143 [Triparma laevis f. longispina]